jgi:hypothetical protein
MVDRRHGPGGHWNDTYPFIRLHQPSAYYGVNSMPLGGDAIDVRGVNAGMYERASGNELCAYYERVMMTGCSLRAESDSSRSAITWEAENSFHC